MFTDRSCHRLHMSGYFAHTVCLAHTMNIEHIPRDPLHLRGAGFLCYDSHYFTESHMLINS